MPRFTILTHDHPFLHWDFLLEHGPACRAWRLLRCPDVTGRIAAEALPDHRLMYLEYEGPVSGNRGNVTIRDSGTFEWLSDQVGLIEVTLTGRTLGGMIRLVQVSDDSWVWERK